MEQVFISYSRRDLAFVKQLAADLQAAGLKVWFDLSGLEAGTRWGREIQNALRESRYFLVVLSPNSVESEWVEREFIYASNLKLKIVPILYRECDLPLYSLNLHYLVLNEENYEDGAGDLLKLLGIKPQPKESAFPPTVEPPVIQPEINEEPAPPVPTGEQKSELTTQPTVGKVESTPVLPALSRAEKLPDSQPQTKEIPSLVSKKEPVEAIPTPILERKEEPIAEVEEKKPEKKPKLKPAPRVKEKIKSSPRPGVKKAWVAGAGGLVGVVLVALGIIFFGGDVRATLFPVKGTQTISSTHLTTAASTPTTSPETTSIATPPIDSDGFRLADGMQMVYVPEGEFTMGSDEGEENEKPAHQVYLDAYWMDQTEVSNAMYALCVKGGVCHQLPYSTGGSVVWVDWNDSKTYCEWAGGRLPTEAEWEKAARGTDGRLYPWGNDDPTCNLASFLSSEGTCFSGVGDGIDNPLGVSPYGVYNLAGIVWEWVSDWYGAYPATLVRNPTGPESSEDKIIRGGAWNSPAENIRSTTRYASSPGSKSDTVGFRCALSANEAVATEAEVFPAVTALPTAMAASTSPIDGMPMVQVPEGGFSMGSDEYKDSQPVHTVHLDEFWIDQTEVTNGMYELCVSAGDCDVPIITEDSTRPDYFNSSVYKDYPVIQVDWNDAQAYCEWAGRRLPTEAEWEKAARGTDGRIHPWGEAEVICDLANYNPSAFSLGCEGIKDTQPVGSHLKNASPYGALDMVGNVAEWVADWYSATYYSESPATNPTGPTSGEDRVLRGSSFRNIKLYLTTFYRRWSGPGGIGDDLGFRCASSTAP